MIEKQFSKIRCLFFLFGFMTSLTLHAQRTSLDDLKLIAPHLLVLAQSVDGTNDVLVGSKITYQKESTISSIKEIEKWMEKYPKEVAIFKKVADTYFNKKSEELIITNEQTTLYKNYKTVWMFINEFNN